MITVLTPLSAFLVLYTLVPLLLANRQKRIRFISDEQSLPRGGVLILVRWLSNKNPACPKDPTAFLQRMRDRFSTIVLFDDDDGASSNQWSYLPLVDQFWKKQLFKDRSLYLKPLIGNRLFTQHYAETATIPDDSKQYWIQDSVQLKKLRVAWNLAIGMYPLSHKRDRLANLTGPLLPRVTSRFLVRRPRRGLEFSEPKQPFCQARYSVKGYPPLIGYQRDFFGRLVEGQSSIRHGFTARQTYNKEMTTAAAVFSPFGWGEVCFRDFEAHQEGAVLIKPDMAHLETWPDTYRAGETFVPVRWDGADFLEAVGRTLADSAAGRRMAERAFEVWASSYGQLENRVERLLGELE